MKRETRRTTSLGLSSLVLQSDTHRGRKVDEGGRIAPGYRFFLARAPLPIAHYIPGKSWAGTLIKDHTGQGFDRSGASLAGLDETEFYHYEKGEEDI